MKKPLYIVPVTCELPICAIDDHVLICRGVGDLKNEETTLPVTCELPICATDDHVLICRGVGDLKNKETPLPVTCELPICATDDHVYVLFLIVTILLLYFPLSRQTYYQILNNCNTMDTTY